MVNIIKENREPSTGERFAKAFANAGSSLGESIPKMMMQKEEQKAQKMQRMQEDQAAKRFGVDLSGIQDPKIRQMALDYALKGQNEEASSGREFSNKSRLGQEEFDRDLQRDEQKGISDFNREQELLFQKNKLASGGKDNQLSENHEEKNTAQNAFNGMIKLLKGGRLGRGSGIRSSLLGGQTGKDVGEFTSLSGALEGLLVDKVSKGSLSNERFKYITETLLPKPTDSDAEIEGKLKGLGQILGLDMSELSQSSKKQSYDLQELTAQDAETHKGRLVEDEQGNRYRSNGRTWVKE